MVKRAASACIVVLDKEEAQARKGVFMIDASQGFMKEGPKNRLRARDMHKIVDAFTKRLEIPGYSRMVSVAEIEDKNDFNLNLPRYIDSQAREDRQDIAGHLQGGIPAEDIEALSAYWRVCPKLRNVLFKPRRGGYLDLAVEKSAIKAAIYGHPEFAAFIEGMNAHFAAWARKAATALKALKPGFHPKHEIALLSDWLLAHYVGRPLIDAYAVYQHFMDTWVETMQDDCYVIAAEGWKAVPERVIETDKKGKERDRGWACDLVPKALIVARFFAKDRAALDTLAAELETVSASVTELAEENAGEDMPFSGFDKITKAGVNDSLRKIGDDKEAADEIAVLKAWLKLDAREADLKRKVKEAEAALDEKALTKYPTLTEAEVKALVVDDKWLKALDAMIHGEMDRVSQRLTARVKELAERYETPLPALAKRVAEMEAKVAVHLARMGFEV